MKRRELMLSDFLGFRHVFSIASNSNLNLQLDGCVIPVDNTTVYSVTKEGVLKGVYDDFYKAMEAYNKLQGF